MDTGAVHLPHSLKEVDRTMSEAVRLDSLGQLETELDGFHGRLFSQEAIGELDTWAVRAMMESTKRSYPAIRRSWALWQVFSERLLGKTAIRIYDYMPPRRYLLADEWDLCRFAAWLVRRVKPKTAASYVSLVRSHHRVITGQDLAEGMPHARIVRVLNGFADLFPSSPRDRAIMTPTVFKEFRKVIDWYHVENLNLTALFELLFGGLLRSCEVLGNKTLRTLTRADVWFEPSLENPTRAWCNANIAKKRGGLHAHSEKDPVLLPYDASAPVNAAFALQQLFLKDRVEKAKEASTPLFRDRRTNVAVKYNQGLEVLKALALRTGHGAEGFGLHSFRIGGATALLAAGCPEAVIKATGRWSSEAFRLYMRSETETLTKWLVKMGRASVDPVQIHRRVRELNIPQHGTPAWDEEMDDIVAEFQEFDLMPEP